MSKREWFVVVVTLGLVAAVISSAVQRDGRSVRACEGMMRDAPTFADSAQIMWHEPDGKHTCAYFLAD